MLRFDVWTGSWSEVGTPWVSAIDPASGRLVATPGTQHQAAFVARLGDGTVLVAGGTTGGWGEYWNFTVQVLKILAMHK